MKLYRQCLCMGALDLGIKINCQGSLVLLVITLEGKPVYPYTHTNYRPRLLLIFWNIWAEKMPFARKMFKHNSMLTCHTS